MKQQIRELADALKVRITEIREKFETASPAQVEVASTALQMVVDELEYLANEMIVDPVQDVIDFHDKFGIGYDGPPRTLDIALQQFRDDRFLDEAREYRKAMDARDREGKLDAIVDSHYIGLGTCILHGWDFNEAWQRVHAANMAKVKASKENPGKFGHSTDIVKPPGWVAPTLIDLV